MLQDIVVKEIYQPSCGFSYRNVQKWVERVEQAAGRAGYTICDLKPLAELLGCEPAMAAIKDSTHSLLGALVSANRRSRTYNCRCVLRPATHTLLHAGELYREVTIMLHTEQLVAWRTADGQEYSSPAHQVTLDPDEDELAAALLTRIAGVEIAPEHMAELRAQMAGGAPPPPWLTTPHRTTCANSSA